MRDILKEIIDKRREDIEKLGIEFGFDIPKTRQRKIHPFIAEKGAILEVKRASPSKGDIAPNLDSGKTAYEYAKCGAKAISCLTETNYFKGTLGDLMNVCRSMDDFEKETGKTAPAVLRKDFLLNVEDVEVAFRAGADAVLLIARILDKELMCSMAKKCEELGISALIEVRKDEDLEKLEYVMSKVNHKNIVCGVNSRDLKDFTIDMLIPSSMLTKIRSISPNARVTFESGILSPNAASFASSMGFNAFLMGEAAAKNPQKTIEFTKAFEETNETKNGKSWVNLADKLLNYKKNVPFVKICGITNEDDAKKATELGADFLGFIMWNKSKRNVDIQKIREIKMSCHFDTLNDQKPKFVGVIVDIDSEEGKNAIQLVKEGILDFIQVHTFDSASQFVNSENVKLPHYCAVNLSSIEDIEKMDLLNKLGEPRILIDAQTENAIGGTGKTLDSKIVGEVSKKYKLWIAGGINSENVCEIIKKFNPELIDISSSLEIEPGKKDYEKMKMFFDAFKNF